MLSLPPLYAIVDLDRAQAAGWSPRDLTLAYLAGGARLVQLRAKQMPSGPLLELATRLAEDARAAGARLVVNDRADVALLSDAGGVHVGQDDLLPDDARRIVGPAMLLGVSTHSPRQVALAVDAPVSYIAMGPIFATHTKDTGYRPVGLELLRHAVERARNGQLPVVAIGGITLERAPACIQTGAASIAVITDLLTTNPEARVRQWIKALS